MFIIIFFIIFIETSLNNKIIINSTYVVYSVDKWVITAVAHCQPITTEEYDVYVTKPKIMLTSKLLVPPEINY